METQSNLEDNDNIKIVIKKNNKRRRRKKIEKDFITYSDDEIIEPSSFVSEENTSKLDDENVFKCNVADCGKEFEDKISLRKHILNHGEKHFVCNYPQCGKKFLDNSKLRRHLLVHTGEKPYECEFCKKCFSLDFNLRTHLRIHTGEKPYICSYSGCFKRFSQSSNLSAHEKSHHIEEDISNLNLQLYNKDNNLISNISLTSINKLQTATDENFTKIRKYPIEIPKVCLETEKDFSINIISSDPLRAEIKRKGCNIIEGNKLYGIITSAYPK